MMSHDSPVPYSVPQGSCNRGDQSAALKVFSAQTWDTGTRLRLVVHLRDENGAEPTHHYHPVRPAASEELHLQQTETIRRFDDNHITGSEYHVTGSHKIGPTHWVHT